MAIIQGNIMSNALQRTVPFAAILPTGDFGVIMGKPKPKGPFKTLYLLHGIGGDHMDWLIGSSIAAMAEEKGIAVIMPSAENGFYVDAAGGADYGRYVGEELVRTTREIFNLSTKREDTFIAGLSMGGYGALRNGLKYSDTFGYAAGLSSALVVDEASAPDDSSWFPFLRRSYFQRTFGDLSKISCSDLDLYALAKTRQQEIKLPRLYLACGTDDELVRENRAFRDYLQAEEIPVTYEEGPGGHEWSFWNTYIAKVLNWLPL